MFMGLSSMNADISCKACYASFCDGVDVIRRHLVLKGWVKLCESPFWPNVTLIYLAVLQLDSQF